MAVERPRYTLRLQPETLRDLQIIAFLQSRPVSRVIDEALNEHIKLAKTLMPERIAAAKRARVG